MPHLYKCCLPHCLPKLSGAPLALTIGNFDGLHLGHQAVLELLKSQAHNFNIASAIMTFEPYPKAFFEPNNAPSRLTSLSEKIVELAHFNLDALFCFTFNRTLATLSAEEFIEQILVKYLNIKILIVGHDFHFGFKRQGNYTLLEKASKTYGFELLSLEPFLLENERVSSTRIRELLDQGNLIAANRLLGHPFFIIGHVGYGAQRGRTWGFPTANIVLHKRKLPLTGIYAVKLEILSTKEEYNGVASIGIRPMYYEPKGILEVYLLNFTGNLYSQKVKITFLHKIREEKKFSNESLLIQQIADDVNQAKNFFQAAL